MWMKATEGADGTVFYIDRDSIKKEGSLIRVWELHITIRGHIVHTEPLSGLMQSDVRFPHVARR